MFPAYQTQSPFARLNLHDKLLVAWGQGCFLRSYSIFEQGCLPND